MGIHEPQNQVFRKSSRLLAMLVAAHLLPGCFAGFFKQKSGSSSNDAPSKVKAEVVSDADGVVTASFKANSTATQTVTASDSAAVSGAALSVPPGALAVDTNITLEEGTDLDSLAILDDLGLGDNEITQKGTSVVISSSEQIDTKTPMTLQLPVPTQAALIQPQDTTLVVLYQAIKAASGGSAFFGLIPSSGFKVVDGKIHVPITLFGSYQAAYLKNEVAEPIEKETTKEIVTKRKELEEKEENSSPTDDPPPALKNLRVTSAGINDLTVAWDKPQDGVTSYQLVAKTSAPSTCADGGFVTETDKDKLSYNFAGLDAATKYHFIVCAVNSAGKLSEGVRTDGTTHEALPPDAKNLDANAVNSTTVRLSFVSGGGNTTGFRVAWNIGASKSAPANCTSGDDETDVDLGDCKISGSDRFCEVDAGPYGALTDLHFRVCAYNSEGAQTVGETKSGTTEGWAISSANCGGGNLDSTCTVTTSIAVAANTQVSGLGTLVIQSGGELTTSAKELVVKVDDLTIGAACGINMNGKGYEGGEDMEDDGDGFGTSGGKGHSSYPTGGAHAGEGGFSKSYFSHLTTSQPFGNFAEPYQDGAPAGAGGGAGSSAAHGGDGGGVVDIVVDNLRLHHATAICADGTIASGMGGGGAGGAIIIKAKHIHDNSGSVGSLTAHGGDGVGGGGGGSGGRIFIAADAIDSKVEYRIHGGASTAAFRGPAGTLFIEDTGTNPSTYKLLTFGNSLADASAADAVTHINPNVHPLDSLEIGKASPEEARVYMSAAHDPDKSGVLGKLPVISSATVDGDIDQSGRGLVGTTGTSSETGGGHHDNTTGGGGGHGGAGGAGADSGAFGGNSHGDAFNPISKGGAGAGDGTNKGGNGGGSLYLKVEGTMTVQSEAGLRANGEPGSGGSGGGAGGSIWIDAGNLTFAGTVVVEAFGAAGGSAGSGGGGGGGGRIRLDTGTGTAPSLTTSGAATAGSGGPGASGGSNGTVVLNGTAQ